MENVLTAVIIIFIILFAILTLSYAFIDSQSSLFDSWREMEIKQSEVEDTSLTIADAFTTDHGEKAYLVVENTGSTRLIDFATWDVIITYFDSDIPPAYHVLYLDYAAPGPDSWQVQAIYHDYMGRNPAANTEEALEPGVLNPGESLVLMLDLAMGIGAGEAAHVTVATTSGVDTSMVFTGNEPPTLTANTGLNLPVNSPITITPAVLSATDDTQTATALLYTVEAGPSAGLLTPADSFTQADIEAGNVLYTHTGPATEDSFTVTLSDGQDTSTSFTIDIVTTQAPVLSANSGLTLSPGSTVTITSAMLAVIDADSAPSDLIYTVSAPPTRGILSVGTTFTQADIEAGMLSYTHGGVEADSFQFTVTDGSTVIGPYMFTVNPM